MPAATHDSPDSIAPSGTVELREDVPLKAGSGGGGGGGGGAGAARCCAAGPRLILAAFAALSAAITLALLTQIYSGDYQLVPHGSVSSSAAECSRAGTDALKAGGRALDATVAAALCLAVVAPHRTSLDASGAMLYWEYRSARTQPAVLYEWGGPGGHADERPPRLLVALASLHARFGTLPWRQLLAPAVQLARDKFVVSKGLSLAAAAGGVPLPPAGAEAAAPRLAALLETLRANTSAELSAAWGGDAAVRASSPLERRAGAWRALVGGAGAAAALRALATALGSPPAGADDDADHAQRLVVTALQRETRAGGGAGTASAAAAGDTADTAGAAAVASGLAVVDQKDTYIALVTGLSKPFGSGPAAAGGWARDEPAAPLDLAPAFLLDGAVCGTRYVIGAESSAALAQGGAALAASGAAGGVEAPRVLLTAGGALALEAARAPPAPAALPLSAPALAPAPALAEAAPPYPAVNVVQQRGDALLSHADSRGGGIASRF